VNEKGEWASDVPANQRCRKKVFDVGAKLHGVQWPTVGSKIIKRKEQEECIGDFAEEGVKSGRKFDRKDGRRQRGQAIRGGQTMDGTKMVREGGERKWEISLEWGSLLQFRSKKKPNQRR